MKEGDKNFQKIWFLLLFSLHICSKRAIRSFECLVLSFELDGEMVWRENQMSKIK